MSDLTIQALQALYEKKRAEEDRSQFPKDRDHDRDYPNLDQHADSTLRNRQNFDGRKRQKRNYDTFNGRNSKENGYSRDSKNFKYDVKKEGNYSNNTVSTQEVTIGNRFSRNRIGTCDPYKIDKPSTSSDIHMKRNDYNALSRAKDYDCEKIEPSESYSSSSRNDHYVRLDQTIDEDDSSTNFNAMAYNYESSSSESTEEDEEEEEDSSEVKADPVWKLIIPLLASTVPNILKHLARDSTGASADLDQMGQRLESLQLRTDVSNVKAEQFWAKVYAHKKFLICEAYGPSKRAATLECYHRLLDICKGWFDALKRISTSWMKKETHAIVLINNIQLKGLLHVEVIREPNGFGYLSYIMINGEEFGRSESDNRKEARENASKATIKYLSEISEELLEGGFQFENTSIMQDYDHTLKRRQSCE